MKYKNLILNALFALILSGALLYSYQTSKKNHKTDPLKIELESPEGKKTLSTYSGKYLLIYFGFLTCPDICPTTLKSFSNVFKEMSPEEQQNIQMLFIDLDPERDSLEAMKIYTNNFHPLITPLRAELFDLQKITESFGIYFKKVPLAGSNMGYTIDHSTGILFLDQKQEIISVIDHDSTTPEILATLRLEMKKGK